AANRLAHHGIVLLAEILSIAAVCCLRIGWRAGRKAEQALTWLRGVIQIRGRECEVRRAERVCGAGFFSGDHAAAGPLVAAFRAAERDCTNDAVAVHHDG